MRNRLLEGKTVLITAGPTREAIDPVRYISNHSSGKMGYALASACLQQGAKVVLVSGPVCLELSDPDLTLLKVQSAADMWKACSEWFPVIDMAIFAAAVADYRPALVAEQKIKKNASAFSISLVKCVDIAAGFGKIKRPSQVSVGFALESENEQLHALDKLKRKNFDMVVLNSINDANAGFGFDTNKISIIKGADSILHFGLRPKSAVAADIVAAAAACFVPVNNFG